MVSRSYRKTVLMTALLVCLFCPAVSSAKMVVGVIFSGNIPYYRSMHVAFLDELKKKLPVGEDVKFIVQFPSPDPVAWSNTAKKLIIGDVDMIMGYGFSATNAVLSKESDIPVMYVGVYDPEAVLHGRNVTGCGYRIPLENLIGYYRQIKETKRLCVIYSTIEEDSVRQINELTRLAAEQNIDLLRLDFNSRGDLDRLNDIGTGDAVFITGSTMAHVMVKDIMSRLQEKQIPVIDIFPDESDQGVLVSFYHDPAQLGRSAADIAARMITGEKASNIEPAVLENTELVINLVAAKKIGVSLPPQLIDKATKIIE